MSLQNVEAITPKVQHEISNCIYLTEPHGQLIYSGKKTLIVKSKKFTSHIKEEMYLLSGKLCYGIIYLEDPFPIENLDEFKKLYNEHRIDLVDLDKWNWKFPLYGYRFKFTKYDPPQPVKIPTGVQVFVEASKVEFLDYSKMSPVDLEYYHMLGHYLNRDYGDTGCKIHFLASTEMIRRGIYHESNSLCDRVVELIRDWRTYDPRKIRDEVLRDDWKIIHAWIKTVCQEGKRFESDQFKDLTLEEQKKVIEDLREKIRSEMLRRGWHPKALEIDQVDLQIQVPDIDVVYVRKLSDRELEDLWKYLHSKWKKEFPDGKVTEDYLNANSFIQIERYKRGLIDETYEDKDLLDEKTRFIWQEYGLPGQEVKGSVKEPPALSSEITLEEVLETLRSSGPVVVKGFPYAAYLTGRLVNEGKIPRDHDIDLALRQAPDPRILIAVRKMTPKWLFDRLHVFFDPNAAGIGLSVPVYGYSLNPLPKDLMKRGYNPYQLEEVKPGKYIIGVKPKCYTEDTEVLTENGWKFLKDVSTSEKVACLNGYRVTFKKPLEKFVYDWSGEIIHFTGDYIDLKVTPEHKMYVKLGFDRHWSKVEAQSLIGNFFRIKRNFYYESKKRPPKEFLGMEIHDFLYLLGVYLAEGHSRHRENGGWEITLALFNEEWEKEIHSLLEKYGIKVHSYKKGVLTFWSEKLARYFIPLGLAFEKKIPNWVKKLPRDCLFSIFKGMFLGDGSKKYQRYTTVSKELADDFQEIALKLGYSSHIGIEKRSSPNRTCYHIFFGNRHRSRVNQNKMHATKEFYSGKVYSLQVQGNLLYVRRNGKSLWSGNSGFGKNEFFDPDDLWTKWGADYIDRGIVVQEKVDGRRMQCHKYNDTIKLITEDEQRDRARLFPEILDEIKNLKGNLILDGEMLVYEFPSNIEGKNARSKREIGDLVPREDTAVITTGNEVPEDVRKRIVYVFYDIMYRDKDLTDLGYEERYNILSDTIPKNCKYLDIVRGETASNMKEFYRLVAKYRSLNGSEGVVCKARDSKYPVKFSGENRTGEWAKLKNLKEIDVIVLDSIQKKTVEGKPIPTWMYVCGFLLPEDRVKEFDQSHVKEYEGKHYFIIGKAYGTGEKVSIGSIVTVKPIRIRIYDKPSGKVVTWMFPFYAGKRPDKKEADTLTTVERIAKLGTGPMKLELDKTVKILLDKCPYYRDSSICPLKKRFVRPINLSRIRVEEEILKYPIMCPLSRYFKCRYVKPYYYEVKEVEDYDSSLDILSLPYYPRTICLQKYMECPRGEHDFVMQGHFIGDSEHMDWRMKVDGYLVGWSIVGANRDNPHTPETLLKNIGKGFRAEEKARQPSEWLKVEGRLPAGEVGGGVEAGGEMKIWTSGKVIFGSMKVYYKEYFLKDPKYFKDWTRIIVRLVKVAKIEPETKVKTKHTEHMWRVMVPKDQIPYAISNRAMEENWKPPRSNPTPFPVEWTKEKFPEQYKKWSEWIGSESLSKVKYTFSQHSYKGPKHIRDIWIRTWYLFLEEGNRVKVYSATDFPVIEGEVAMVYEGTESNRYLNFEGKTRPDSRFNPNKEIYGEMKILSSGSVDMEEMEGEVEKYKLSFSSGILKGTWYLEQEEKGSDIFTFYKEGLSLGGVEGRFVYQKHTIGDRFHYDFRYLKNGSNIVDEFNLYSDIREEPAQGVKKTCDDPSWMDISEKTIKYVGPLKTTVEPIDKGKLTVIEENPDFISFNLEGKELRGFYIAKKDHTWIFRKSSIAKGLSNGLPSSGPYKDFIVQEKKGWTYFNVFLYDMREFSRSEDPSKVSKYLPELKIPPGVTVFIGLFPRLGKMPGARVAFVRFQKDKWTVDSARDWIIKNSLHTWSGSMIRE